MAQAYCMKCRKKVEIKNPSKIILKNKRHRPRLWDQGIQDRQGLESATVT